MILELALLVFQCVTIGFLVGLFIAKRIAPELSYYQLLRILWSELRILWS